LGSSLWLQSALRGPMGSTPGCPRAPSLPWSHEACKWRAGSAEEYRQLQEIAYVNNDGASATSVYGLMLIYPLVVCLHHLASLLMPPPSADASWAALTRAAMLDFLLPTLVLTVCFSSPQLSALHIVVLCCACLASCAAASVRPSELLSWRGCKEAKAWPSSFTAVDKDGLRLRFVAEYRAVIMITTCLAILAVDFPSLFARSQAKTEEYGYSLMDLGTGCIVCSTAVCSKAARGVWQGRRPSALLRRVASLWPVLAIGFSRLLVLRGIDYHVPTSEYGVHWNFFFTIAFVALVSTVADFGARQSGVAGLALLAAYQVFLSQFGGADYILHAPRVDLFSANREGALSCLGFLGIHWLSVALGALARPGPVHPAAQVVGALLVVAAACAAAVWLLASPLLGVGVSRRMCNLPYALLALSVNATVLGSLALVDLLLPRPRPPLPLTYGGVQDSMLIVFLVANLLTGAVNLSVHSLLVPQWAAMLIMAGYSLAWTVPFGLLRAAGVALKFW